MLNILQQEQLKMVFVEAKWLYNYLLSLLNERKIDIFKVNTKNINTVTHFNKDKKLIESPLNYLGSSMKQSLVKDMCTSIKALSTLKKKGKKIGSLSFKSNYCSINLKQYGITHKIVSENKIKIQGIKKPLCVSGLKQLSKLIDYEIANAHLIKRCDDYYIQLTVLLNKTDIFNKTFKNDQLGIDFGCETSFSLSNGTKINAYIEETDHLKRLQRKLQRQKKGSNNRYKTCIKIQKQYQKLTNLKNEYTNQLVHKLLSENRQIIIQDEQLHCWQKKHGKKIQHSILGRVKNKLMRSDQVVVLNKFIPTTKLCNDCGYIHTEIKLYDREFICPNCGVIYDRDIHAAQNMVWIYNNIIGVDGTEFKRLDFEKQLQAKFKK